MISIVVATDKNQVIGNENKIPWRLRSDLIRLKELSFGHTVILGRKTYDSMAGYYKQSGRQLPGKTYIIITKNPDYKPLHENTRLAHSAQEALDIAKELGDENILVIGGAAIYELLLPMTDKIYLTEVQTEVDGDTYFPTLEPGQWQETERKLHAKDEKNQFDYSFITLVRK